MSGPIISSAEERDDEVQVGSLATLERAGFVPINQLSLKEADLIRRTEGLRPLLTPDTPSGSDRSLEGRVTIGEPSQIGEGEIDDRASRYADMSAALNDATEILEQVGLEVAEGAPLPDKAVLEFPFLAMEAVSLGLAKEGEVNRQISGHIQNVRAMQKDIDLLLDLNTELTAHPAGEPASDKIKQILSQLKERNIEIWKGEEGQKWTKEKISELKSLSNAQADKLRSNIQIIFTTKIQTLIQLISSIMDILKDIIRNNTKLVNAANRLPGH